MRAAQLGIALSHLEVTVDSISDDKGLLGMDEETFAGPYSVRMKICIGAEGVDAETLHEIIAWTERHSPVADAIRRAVPTVVEVEIA